MTSLRRCVGTVVLAVGAWAGLAGAADQSPGGRPWVCTTSTVVTACGDVSNFDVLRAASTILAFRDAILDVFPADVSGASAPTTVLIFHDRKTFLPYLPRDENGRPRLSVGAYFTSQSARTLIAMALDGDRNVDLPTVLHEYTHYLSGHTALALPTWLSEGLAEYYSTFETTPDGEFLVGKALPNALAVLARRPLIPLAQMTSAEAVEKIYRDEVQLGAFYAEAWAVTHYLMLGHSGTRQGQMMAYLNGLRSGQRSPAAFERAFGPFSTLEREMFDYVRQSRFPFVRHTRAVVGGVGPATPTLSEPAAVSAAAAAQMQADVLISTGWLEEGTKRVQASLALEPDRPEALVTLGRAQLRARDWDNAEHTLTRAAAQAPASFDALFHLGVVLRQRKAFDRAYDTLVKATTANPGSEDAWVEQSLAASALHRDEVADAAFAQAQKVSSHVGLLRMRAYGALLVGRPELTVTAAQQYLERAGPDDQTAYAAFEGVIGAWRSGQPTVARALAESVRGSGGKDSWPATIAKFMTGELKADALLEKARSDGQKTEAHAYVGLKADADGDRAGALPHLQWVKTQGRKDYTEYALAAEALERLVVSGAAAALESGRRLPSS